MSVLVVPKRFYPGDPISSSDLDENFTSIKTLFNTTKFNEDNLRRFSGISNDRKTAPYAHHVISFGIPQFTVPAGGSKVFLVWGFPYYKQPRYTELSGAIGTDNVVGGNYPIQIKNIQATYHSATNMNAGDTFAMTVGACRKNFVGAASGPSTLIIPTDGSGDNVIQSSDVSGWDDVVYAVAFISYSAVIAGATRTVYNTTGSICVKMAHVR